MPSKILTDLAPELIIQILKSSDSFADLTSLSSTSRKMFIIWKTNIDGICEAILPRTVPYYAQARELIEAQEKAEGDEHSVFGYQSAVDRAKWMFEDADTAAKVLDHFEQWVCGKLSWAEQQDFIRAYYRATTLAILGEEPLSCQLLLSWTTLDFGQVKDVTEWLGIHCNDLQLRRLNLRVCREVWAKFHRSMVYTRWDLNGVTSWLEQYTDTGRLFPFILHPPFREYKSNRGPRLADLLPLLSK